MRFVLHLDADAFFASVEQAADPRLRGRPVAVGGEQRGIIASASYEARRFGITTPMPTSRARKLCPQLILLPGDYEKYERFSQWMFSYAYDFTPDVEITSIDEGYLDLTSTRKNPVLIARTLRDAIHQSLKITVSEGIGSNKLISQIASKLNKPDAFSEIPNGREMAFLHPLPNRWLPGIGPATSGRLNAAGLPRIGQVASTPTELLEMLVGSSAPQLRAFAQGVDTRPIIPLRPAAKSYSQQETFAQDQTDEAFLDATLHRMTDHLMAKVRGDGKSIRTVTVKVRYNDMDEDQCSESLLEPTDLETHLYSRLPILLRKAWQRRVSLRLVSLKLSSVYEGIFRLELPLDRSFQQEDAQRRLAKTIDELRHTRGYQTILRGHDLLLRDRAQTKTGYPTRSAKKHSLFPTRNQRTAIRRVDTASCSPMPLGVRSYYSFLDSTLSPEAIMEWAVREKLPSIALCDRGNLHGAPAFAAAAQAAGIQPVIGAELLIEGHPIWLYAKDRTGYIQLCRWLSGPPLNNLEAQSTEGLLAVSSHVPFAIHFPDRFYRGIRTPKELKAIDDFVDLPSVPMMPVHYASAVDRWNYDVAQSIRTLTLLRQPHPEKQTQGHFHFRTATEMHLLFQSHPEALAHTHEIAERCAEFVFPFGPPQFPPFHSSTGESSRAFLRRLVVEGARKRYSGKLFQTIQPQLETELQMIHEVGYEDYFLVVWDLVQDCRRLAIQWITRGSAADSLVCYCLEISTVCPIRFDLYFRRFLNRERMALNKLPDIDIDFPHDRKDDVVDLLFRKYGPEHCAVVGGFSTFHIRSALGDVAKVLGVSERQIRRITDQLPGVYGSLTQEPDENHPFTLPPDVAGEEPYVSALKMAQFLDGFPRYAKMHPCGVVLSRQPIHEIAPTFISAKGYRTTHYDMDAVEAMGLVKMDILAQGGLAVMRDVEQELLKQGILIDLDRCVARVSPEYPSLSLPASVTQEYPDWSHPSIWKLIASGGARAVHHIESPAMISLCQMCQVGEIDGLVAIVSVIRPGAANEQKKVQFTRRYQGLESPYYPHPCLEPCLRSTFGLVVYEEHILQICEAFAGLGGGRADVLRRALVKQRKEEVKRIGVEFTDAARARGHSDVLIQEVWEWVTGFNGYAFCRAHSTAYGVEAYQAAWLKLHFPADFMASVLTHGKGFYSPLVYILECHRLGIPITPPWINEPGPAFPVTVNPRDGKKSIRIPVSKVKHLTESTWNRLVQERRREAFSCARDFYLRVRPNQEEIEALLNVGAFDLFQKSRTALFWELQQVHRAFGCVKEVNQGWLLPPPGLDRLPDGILTEPGRIQCLEWETELLGYTASGHPLDLYPHIAWETYCPVNRLGDFLGQEVVTCGLVIEQRIHHQSTGEPMKFLTLCDRTGIVETELFAATYRNYGLATVRYPVLEVTARVEPFENGKGHTLRVMRAGKPRTTDPSPFGVPPSGGRASADERAGQRPPTP